MATLFRNGEVVGEVQVRWTMAAFRPDLGGVLGQERPARVALTLETFATYDFLDGDSNLEFEDDKGDRWVFRCSGVADARRLTGAAWREGSQ